MCKVFGIDLGNGAVKTSEGVKFMSRVKNEITKFNKDDIKVRYKNDDYTLGTVDGRDNTSKNKYVKTSFKLSLLTAIAKSTSEKNITAKVVLGVPVKSYNDDELVNKIKETVMSYDTPETITVEGVEKKIIIKDIKIFPESGIIFLDKNRFKNEKTLVCDIGYGTIDISLWNGLRLENSSTFKTGMASLYQQIINKVNDKYGVNLETSEAEFMICKKFYTIKQEKKDISFINVIIENYVSDLASKIEQNYDTDKADSIQLIGGGAKALKNWLKEDFNIEDIFEDAEFANANTFKTVGEAVWL